MESRRISILMSLENGKTLGFGISNIKEVTVDDIRESVKNFPYTKVFSKNGKKVTGIKNANIITTQTEEII